MRSEGEGEGEGKVGSKQEQTLAIQDHLTHATPHYKAVN